MNNLQHKMKLNVDQLAQDIQVLAVEFRNKKSKNNPHKLNLVIQRTSDFGLSMNWKRTSKYWSPVEGGFVLHIRPKHNKCYTLDVLKRYAAPEDHTLVENLERKLSIVRQKVTAYSEINKQLKKLEKLNK